MCGIIGIFSNDETRSEQVGIVRAMSAQLVHRGPDGEGIFEGKTFTLGHRRLAILDLVTGAQPMVNEDGEGVITFNGEIYNYVELREDLVKKGGVAFRTTSDTEVLLKLIEYSGFSAISRLNGMFAFAYVNRKSGQWMLCRDPFGIKPLYYTVVDGEVIFASEIKAILVHPKVQRKAQWQSLQNYLVLQVPLGNETLFQGIKSVEPGTIVHGSGGKVTQINRYYEPCYEIDEDHTEHYFVEKLRSLLRDSIRIQMRSDVPIGAYLSGGLDSSVVTSLASSILGRGMKAFHGKFLEGRAYDESEYAEVVASRSGAELFTVIPTASDFVRDLPRLIWALDEPVAGPGVFPQYAVSQLASKHVKVVLGGQGGDELFGGYARYLIAYLEQAMKGAIFETQEEGKHLVTLSSIVPNLPLLREYRSLMQQFWSDGLFEEMDQRYFRLIDRSPDVENLLSKDARSRFKLSDTYEHFRDVFNHTATKSYINKMTYFDLKTLLPALLQVEDRVSMAVSVESRVPLLDVRIVDLMGAIPPPLKFKGGKTKAILREAVQTFVPSEVMARKDKMGFPIPLAEWLKAGVVREFVRDTLLSQQSRERGLFDASALQKLLDSERAFGRQLWGALCLELWYQQFIDSASTQLATMRPQEANIKRSEALLQ